MIIISHIMMLMIIIIITIIIIYNYNNNNAYDHKQVFSKYLASCSLLSDLLSDVIRHGMAWLELTFTG